MKKFLLNTENYVVSLLTKKLNKDYLFHNLAKTQQVVYSVKELIEGEKITEVDANILLFASWFHDIGYVNRKENHQESSVNIATTFLEEYNIDNSIIDEVARLIRATKVNSDPQDLLEKIMKDAVSFYYAQNSFIDRNELLKQELKLLFNDDYTELEWLQKSIHIFVKKHRFFTNYAQKKWQQGKDKNLSKLVKKEKKLLKKTAPKNTTENPFKTYNALTIKAVILLAINALIFLFSLVGYYFVKDVVENDEELIPAGIFLFFNTISVVLLLFFAISFKFKEGVSKDSLIHKMNSKRKVLKSAFLILVFGFVISVITFIVTETIISV